MHQENLKPVFTSIVKELGYNLLKLSFVEENQINYLRLTISHNENPITTDDCEKVSVVIDEYLEEKDPIPFSYTLEVESPGIDFNPESETLKDTLIIETNDLNDLQSFVLEKSSIASKN